MNIFLNQEGFFQAVQNQAPPGALLPLFRLAPQMKEQLGEQRSFVSNYVYLFFRSLYHVSAFRAAHTEEKELCKPVVGGCLIRMINEKMEAEDRAFVEKLKSYIPACLKASPKKPEPEIKFDKIYDHFCLMSLLISDDMAVYSSSEDLKQQVADFYKQADIAQMHELYEQISAIVGEPLMDALNQELKRRFLIAPTAYIIASRISDSTIRMLFARDNKTCRLMYQFLLSI